MGELPQARPSRLRALCLGALPMLLALVVAGYGALERVTVDPAVAAGREGAFPAPAWYPPLAAFGLAYTAILLVAMRGKTPVGTGLAGLALIGALAVHGFGLPFLLGETAYGFFLIIMVLIPPLILLLPVAAAVGLAAGGALFGLTIHLPLALARRLARDGEAAAAPTGRALVIGGIVAAVIAVTFFGPPTQAALAARGAYYFPALDVETAWLHSAPAIAACCAAITLAGAWPFSQPGRRSPLLGAFAVVAIAVALGGALLKAIEPTSAVAALRSSRFLEPLSLVFRDGRPRIDAPILFANGELRIDRSRLRYRTADNPERRTVTVGIAPSPELQAVGVRTIALNAWPAPAHRAEAEARRAVCADDPARPLILCRYRPDAQPAIEIDRARPHFAFERAGGADGGCRVILSDVAGRGMSAYADFDCARAADWPRAAALIEERLAALHHRR